ncbi:arylphorin subunit alpha-like [Copidosoma floridanum]|uniref:arylphorin subunit alpha-like n=1 Tax=Copidosoma floridanum TaxID=29053 RepID=UPI0006C96FE7|nr:arylphorin subunit alpha-like [Copidosoma floridanum]
MLGRLVLLSAVAVGWVTAQAYKPEHKIEHTADMDFLLKQKRVYQIMYHSNMPELKAELHKEGQEYDVEANKDNYTNKEVVTEFLRRYEHGFLPSEADFSIYHPRCLAETIAVFRLLYYAKDFDTFYKTALFCRNRISPSVFSYAYYLAVIHRPDTKFMKLPPLYEITPTYFYNRELLEKAHHYKKHGQFVPKHSAGYDAYVIPYNYSRVSSEYDYEQRLAYFTEDVGLNVFYYFLRNMYPFFMSSEEFGWPKYFRGEEYLYGQDHLFNRFYLERLSNDLGKIEDYDHSRPFYPGYWPSLDHPNGQQFPSRPADAYFPRDKYKKIREFEEYESRINQALDSGIVYTKEGKTEKILNYGGINILGNMIEGNADSCNPMYYGNIEALGRNIIGFGSDPDTSNNPVSSALEHLVTSVRDPGVWRLWKRILDFYRRYKKNLQPYKPEKIRFPELKIESVTTDRLETFFEPFDVTISHGLPIVSEHEAKDHVVQTRQYRLNHKPFKLYINIESEKEVNTSIRLYFGPKYNVHGQEESLQQRRPYFYSLDMILYRLSPGMNKIERDCNDLFFTVEDSDPSEVYYKKVLDAIAGSGELKYQQVVYGFPQRLILPRGRPEGMPYQLYVHVSPLESDPLYYWSPTIGESLLDSRHFGFPLDRPFHEHEFHGPNFYAKDVLIYHSMENDVGY